MSARSRDLDRLKIPGSVREVLKEFLARVRDVLGEAEVYLFGSYARGDWLYDSDLDLVVVSPRFRGLDLGKRHVMVRDLISSKVSVELLLYTPEEFERVRRRSTIIRDAMKYWVRLL